MYGMQVFRKLEMIIDSLEDFQEICMKTVPSAVFVSLWEFLCQKLEKYVTLLETNFHEKRAPKSKWILNESDTFSLPSRLVTSYKSSTPQCGPDKVKLKDSL